MEKKNGAMKRRNPGESSNRSSGETTTDEASTTHQDDDEEGTITQRDLSRILREAEKQRQQQEGRGSSCSGTIACAIGDAEQYAIEQKQRALFEEALGLPGNMSPPLQASQYPPTGASAKEVPGSAEGEPGDFLREQAKNDITAKHEFLKEAGISLVGHRNRFSSAL